MQPIVDLLNKSIPILYFICLGIYSYDFMKEVKGLNDVKRLFLFLTLLVHVCYLILRSFYLHHFPITNVFEIFTVLAFATAFAYFILELLTDIRGTGPFIIIISLVFQIVSSLFVRDENVVNEVLRSNLLGSHVFSALLGYAGITISAVYGVLYLMLYNDIKLNRFSLIFERLPNLEILEKLSYYAAIIGFTLLTAAILIGIIWLPMAFKEFSYTDPKLIGTGIVWLLYGLGILGRWRGKWRGKKVMTLSITGFVIALLSTMVTNFLAKSFHTFYK